MSTFIRCLIASFVLTISAFATVYLFPTEYVCVQTVEQQNGPDLTNVITVKDHGLWFSYTDKIGTFNSGLMSTVNDPNIKGRMNQTKTGTFIRSDKGETPTYMHVDNYYKVTKMMKQCDKK
ncbi:hypothetical protein RJO65_004872 [Enterobacter hormaechei]|nr:hypothetical protein [Enterobacter hormaechei]